MKTDRKERKLLVVEVVNVAEEEEEESTTKPERSKYGRRSLTKKIRKKIPMSMKIKKAHQVMTTKLKHKSKQLLSKYLIRKNLMKMADVVTRKKLRKHPNLLLLHKCLATKTSSQLE